MQRCKHRAPLSDSGARCFISSDATNNRNRSIYLLLPEEIKSLSILLSTPHSSIVAHDLHLILSHRRSRQDHQLQQLHSQISCLFHGFLIVISPSATFRWPSYCHSIELNRSRLYLLFSCLSLRDALIEDVLRFYDFRARNSICDFAQRSSPRPFFLLALVSVCFFHQD